jgi:hypothetical protein
VIFKIYDCDFGIKLNAVSYEFTHVVNLAIEDPENTRLTRGANAGNKTGIVYKEGIKEPKKVTVTIQDMSAELFAVLSAAYADKSRMDVYAISRGDGSSKMAKNAVLSQQPQQLSLDEGPDSMNVALAFESFDLSEVHKS